MAELLVNPHLQGRKFWTRIDGITYPGAPFQMSATPWQLQRQAPKVDEHTHFLQHGFQQAMAVGLSSAKVLLWHTAG
jgi:crotonobetainyl-CoA:carnitine CoA-transferase CaiB-like acyl-CoA transferase